MVPIEITPATVILGLLVALLAVFALRRLMKNGMCDCHKGKSAGCSGCCEHTAASGENNYGINAVGASGMSCGCTGCSVSERMVFDLDQSLKQRGKQ